MQRRFRAPVPLGLLVGATIALGGACGDDDDSSAYSDRATTTTTASTGATTPGGTDGTATADGEPPEAFDALAAAFGPALDELGLELTRASVSRPATGTHIALYGVPATDADDPQDYLDRLLASTVAAGTIAFEGYGAVASFDICQEPTGTNEEAPPPVTIAVLTREQWESVPDWADADLADLLEAATAGEGGQIDVRDDVRELPEFEAAVDELQDRRG